MEFKTEQEEFWAGEFGNDYVDRNSDLKRIATRAAFFSKVIHRTKNINSIIEFGANVGQNILAIRMLKPLCSIGAVEINVKAVRVLEKIPNTTVFSGSIFNFSPEELGKFDLTFTSGVLIHINPDKLSQVYSRLYECSTKYILINEYYNPTPTEVHYRGHHGRLFKRDFAGELLDLYRDLEMVDYGFQYHKDPNFPMDDLNWFLLEKKC